jgi:hypothetical protein
MHSSKIFEGMGPGSFHTAKSVSPHEQHHQKRIDLLIFSEQYASSFVEHMRRIDIILYDTHIITWNGERLAKLLLPTGFTKGGVYIKAESVPPTMAARNRKKHTPLPQKRITR